MTQDQLNPPHRDMDPADPEVAFIAESDGRSTRVDLAVGGRSVSRCWIVSQRIRIGAASVRMDGIGGVGTDEGERTRGYGRRVMEAAVRRMMDGDAAISMLYGIPDYYERFGYASAGPEHYIRMPIVPPNECHGMPEGWSARAAGPDDVDRLERIYIQQTEGSVGAAIRTERCYAMRRMREAARGCEDRLTVVVDPSGQVDGYAWRGAGFWATDVLDRDFPDHLVLSEAMAANRIAADAVIALCRQWPTIVAPAPRRQPKLDGTRTHLLLAAPHDGLIAASARRMGATLERRYSRTGGSMARVLNAERLLAAIAPELDRRARSAGIRSARPLRVVWAALMQHDGTDGTYGTWRRRSGDGSAERYELALPACELARAVLGAAPPEDILARISWNKQTTRPMSGATRQVFATIFPEVCPHMHLPDRY